MPAKKTSAPVKKAPRRAPLKKVAVAATAKARAKPVLPFPPPAMARPMAPEAAPKKPAKQRPRLVRDGFTMPESDFALIAALKGRALAARRETKKSELLRAGLHVLMALDEGALLATLGRLQPLKTGRPKKNH